MSKLLTISVAAYNVEKYIRQALDSLVEPEIIDDLEIFVVDDGGTDDTLKIAREYAKTYPQSIFPVHKENGGYGSTINYSVAHATGKYFKQLDGDDWFDRDGLKQHLMDLKQIDADMVLCSYMVYNEKNGTQEMIDHVPDLEKSMYDIEDIRLKETLRMHSITYRTETLQKMGLHITEHCFYTDCEYVLFPLKNVRSLYVSHTPLYCYRYGMEEQSVSYMGFVRHFEDHERVSASVRDLYMKESKAEGNYVNWIRDMAAEVAGKQYRFLCMIGISRENRKRMMEYDRSLKENPTLYKAVIPYSKLIIPLRKSHFLLYPFACLWVRRRKMLEKMNLGALRRRPVGGGIPDNITFEFDCFTMPHTLLLGGAA